MIKTILLGVILAPFAVVGITYHQVNMYQSNWQELPPGDCLVILGSRTLPGGRPGLMMRERTQTALEVISDDIKNIFVTGGSLDEEKTEAQVMKEILTDGGIEDQNIILEDQSTSTYENLVFVKPLLLENDCEKTDLLSHDFHLARVKQTAQRLDIVPHRLIPAQQTKTNSSARLSREYLAYLWYWLGWNFIEEG